MTKDVSGYDRAMLWLIGGMGFTALLAVIQALRSPTQPDAAVPLTLGLAAMVLLLMTFVLKAYNAAGRKRLMLGLLIASAIMLLQLLGAIGWPHLALSVLMFVFCALLLLRNLLYQEEKTDEGLVEIRPGLEGF